jgi:hypothetical protein
VRIIIIAINPERNSTIMKELRMENQCTCRESALARERVRAREREGERARERESERA